VAGSTVVEVPVPLWRLSKRHSLKACCKGLLIPTKRWRRLWSWDRGERRDALVASPLGGWTSNIGVMHRWRRCMRSRSPGTRPHIDGPSPHVVVVGCSSHRGFRCLRLQTTRGDRNRDRVDQSTHPRIGAFFLR